MKSIGPNMVFRGPKYSVTRTVSRSYNPDKKKYYLSGTIKSGQTDFFTPSGVQLMNNCILGSKCIAGCFDIEAKMLISKYQS